jgi:hypothetical protein
MALIGEAGGGRECSERDLGGDELTCSELHSQLSDIVPQCTPAVLSKNARQVDRVNAGFRRDRFKREIFSEPVVKQFTHPLEPRWSLSDAIARAPSRALGQKLEEQSFHDQR